METLDDLYDAFKGPAGVGRAIGKSTEHAFAMKRRRSVPVRYWPALLSAARSLNLKLDEACLVRIHTSSCEGANAARP